MPESTPPETTPQDATATKTARKGAKNLPVGTTVEVADGTQVVRPDGSIKTVSGTAYVLDVPGTFRLGDDEVTAHDPEGK